MVNIERRKTIQLRFEIWNPNIQIKLNRSRLTKIKTKKKKRIAVNKKDDNSIKVETVTEIESCIAKLDRQKQQQQTK